MTIFIDLAPLGVIDFADATPVDAVLEAVARQLMAEGRIPGGFLQREGPAPAGCCAAMDLEDLRTGALIRISQDLGPAARGCRLDPRGLAEASAAAQSAIGQGIDLLIINRFGKGEADGQGLRAAMIAALEAGIPVLTAARPAYMPACAAFHGGLATVLNPDAAQILDWCRGAMRQPARIAEHHS